MFNLSGLRNAQPYLPSQIEKKRMRDEMMSAWKTDGTNDAPYNVALIKTFAGMHIFKSFYTRATYNFIPGKEKS